jgi:hypothetical protein
VANFGTMRSSFQSSNHKFSKLQNCSRARNGYLLLMRSQPRSCGRVEDFIRSENHTHLKVFAQRAAVSFVYSSNRMEQTLPKGVPKQTRFQFLETLVEDHSGLEVSQPVSWRADGSNREEMRSQMMQHCKALRLASGWSNDLLHKLDADEICRLHGT